MNTRTSPVEPLAHPAPVIASTVASAGRCPLPALRIRGFTITELVAVIVITGILAAVAAPRLFDRTSFEERGFYDEVLFAARYAQKFAYTSGCEVQLSIASNAYALHQQATNCTTGNFTSAVVHPSDRTRTFSGTAPGSITVSITNNPVVFKPSGSTSDSTDRTVTVGSRSFQIIGATGFAYAQ